MSDVISELHDTVLEFRDRVVGDLTTLRSDVGALDSKVGTLDDKISTLDDNVGEVRARVDAVVDRVEDLRRTLLEFRISVSQELGVTSRRIDVLRDDITAHIRSSQTGILNTIRDLSHETDRRTTWLEGRMAELERRIDDRPSS